MMWNINWERKKINNSKLMCIKNKIVVLNSILKLNEYLISVYNSVSLFSLSTLVNE